MKYIGGSPSTLFCEQVSTVTSLFEKWSDCERTVVMYALLKRLRYPSLKFLQYSIESNLTQNFGSQNLATNDINANNPIYLQQLVSAYKSDNDPLIYGSDIQRDGERASNKKEEVLSDVLDMLPLLKPGNEEAKAVYLSLIPLAVEDTGKQVVDTEIVQQIFSYLLIHPAITNEDRRSLGQWLRHLEENIQSSFCTGHQNFYVLTNPLDCGPKSGSVSSLSNDSIRSWQTIAPPTQSGNKQQQQQNQSQVPPAPPVLSHVPNEWSSSLLQLPDNLCEDIQRVSLGEVPSSQNSLGLIYDSQVMGTDPGNNSSDDLHVSFSKNGTEIIDFEANDCDKCTNPMSFSSLFSNPCEHVTPPRWSLDNSSAALKTRRSNSLTTAAISSSSSSTPSVIIGNEQCSNSSENLAQYSQKPRSFSLSIENPRGTLTSSGSDTRLDDLKPNYLKFTSHNIGMSNIGQWLKSLRLHKYIGLFTNMTYEDMLSITEDFLQSLGVTKGASHKLAICIEKLKDRFNRLTKVEQDLLANNVTINVATEELTNIVLSPMKPADASHNNVAAKFLQVLDLICHAIAKKEINCQQDEDCVNALLWILERSIHNEAFVAHTNQLKEHKFRLSKIKMQFAPKNHHMKSSSNTSLNKPRWNGKARKVDKGSNDRINRKNSSETLTYSINTLQHTSTIPSITSQNCHDVDKYHSVKSSQPYNSCQQYKSSSYPNFTNAGKVGAPQPQYRHHRHSLNNLIVVSTNSQQSQHVSFKMPKSVVNLSKSNVNVSTPNNMVDSKPRQGLKKSTVPTSTIAPQSVSSTTAAPTAVAAASATVVVSEQLSVMGTALVDSSAAPCSTVSSTKSNLTSISLASSKQNKDKSSKNTIGDINSSLEFLCLQMTEQAIN